MLPGHGVMQDVSPARSAVAQRLPRYFREEPCKTNKERQGQHESKRLVGAADPIID
jgi:hypothetical protein